jgi:hypothetical protein
MEVMNAELARSANLHSEIWTLAVSSSREAGAAQAPKLFLVLYRFGAALVFFNAPYFKKRVLGIRLGFANPRTEVRALLERSGVEAALGDGALFTTLKSAVDACACGGIAETSETGTEPS